ncbi:MAG TPA: DinB family protein [Vicinamibacterales bacterium]|jgi:uncharacterized damage-inducible protein DinB|nr:DinB family protein [Vicinamibacterales bacterium]
MKRLLLAAALVCLAAAGPRAQTTAPYIGEIKRYYYDSMKRNLAAMVEKMPEEHFAFRPVAEIRSFGEAVAHVADAQARNCQLASGAGAKTLDAEKRRTKAELLAALRDSFAICDAAFAALSEARASEMITMGQSGFQISRLSLLVSMIAHSNELHGYMAVYLRLKGIVPPSTEAMNAGR